MIKYKTKYLTLTFLIMLVIPSYSQIKDNNLIKDNVRDGIVNENNNYILGIFNPQNFRMDHIYNLSFSTSGSNQLAVGSYTNRLFYKFNNKLNFQLWTSIVTTPYNSISGDNRNKYDGIFIDKASINYRPSKNFMIDIQYSNNPYRYYNSYYNYNRFGVFNYGYDFNPFIY